MPRILYRADGGHPLGTGHIIRALRVAACWREICPDAQVLLVSHQSQAVRELVERAALPNIATQDLPACGLGPMPRLVASDFADLATGYQPDVIVIDMLDTPAAEMQVLRGLAPTLVTLDDRGAGRLLADLIVNFLVRDPDPSELDPDRTWLREGPEYASLAPEFVGVLRGRSEPPVARRMLVSMGGADAAGLAARVAEDLLTVDGLEEVDFTVGVAFQDRATLESIVARAPWEGVIHTAVPSLLPLYRSADLAIVAGGITMHEVACCSVPAIAVCQPIDHQLLVAEWLEDKGCMLNLGYGEELPPGEIAAAARSLIGDQPRRQSMSEAGPRVCDGRGSLRTAEVILERAEG